MSSPWERVGSTYGGPYEVIELRDVTGRRCIIGVWLGKAETARTFEADECYSVVQYAREDMAGELRRRRDSLPTVRA